MSLDVAPVRRVSWKVEVTFGYLLQVVSVVLLLLQHFLLPFVLGLRDYGLLALTVGWSSLLFSGYDHGYNLLTIRRPALGRHYLANKLAILSLAALGFLVYVRLEPDLPAGIFIPVLLQAISFVVYTYLINHEIAVGRLKRVVIFAVINGILLILTPVAFASAGIGITFAPAAATALSLFVVVAARRREPGLPARRPILRTPLRLTHLRRSFVKQGQISFGTIIDATIVWLGVVVIASQEGLEGAAVYRIVMSSIALLTQLLPLPKAVLLRLARTESSFSWAFRYLAILVLAGVVQIVAVYLIGRQAVSMVFSDTVDAIYSGVVLLSPIALLKALLDLETILYDRANRLSRLWSNGLIATVPGVAAFVALDLYWSILAFYVTLGVLSASAFLLTPSASGPLTARPRAG